MLVALGFCQGDQVLAEDFPLAVPLIRTWGRKVERRPSGFDGALSGRQGILGAVVLLIRLSQEDKRIT